MYALVAADLVGIGTLALAFVTAALAAAAFVQVLLTRKVLGTTERSVEATERSVEIAQRQFAASLRPIVAVVPEGVYREAEEVVFTGWGARKEATAQDRGEVIERIHEEEQTRLLSIPFRNIGPGIAVVITSRDATISTERDGIRFTGRATHNVIPSGELGRLNFGVSRETPAHHFYAEIAYADISGEQLTRTQLFVARRKQGDPLHVAGIALFAGDEKEPSVVSGQGFG